MVLMDSWAHPKHQFLLFECIWLTLKTICRFGFFLFYLFLYYCVVCVLIEMGNFLLLEIVILAI